MIVKRRFICYFNRRPSKYWNCWTEGNRLISEWGSVNSEPTSKARTFRTLLQAELAMRELICAKTLGRMRDGRFEQYEEIDPEEIETNSVNDTAARQKKRKRLTCGTIRTLDSRFIHEKLSIWLKEHDWTFPAKSSRLGKCSIHAAKKNTQWMITISGGMNNPVKNRAKYYEALGRTVSRPAEKGEDRCFVALPDIPENRSLWAELPTWVKTKGGIGAIFVDTIGRISFAK